MSMRKLLYFYAPWCSPCKFYDREIIAPLEQRVGTHRITRINVQDEPFNADKYGVDKLPAIVILDNEKIVMRSTGGYTTDQLEDLIKGVEDRGYINN